METKVYKNIKNKKLTNSFGEFIYTFLIIYKRNVYCMQGFGTNIHDAIKNWANRLSCDDIQFISRKQKLKLLKKINYQIEYFPLEDDYKFTNKWYLNFEFKKNDGLMVDILKTSSVTNSPCSSDLYSFFVIYNKHIYFSQNKGEFLIDSIEKWLKELFEKKRKHFPLICSKVLNKNIPELIKNGKLLSVKKLKNIWSIKTAINEKDCLIYIVKTISYESTY
jgi:hypothetical protein